MRLRLLVPLLLGVLSLTAADPDPGVPGRQVEARHPRGGSFPEVPYLLYLPKGYGETEGRFPLVLFLHGAGERGTDLTRVAVHGPPRQAAAGRDLPFLLVSPQCPAGRVWDDVDLPGLLDDVTTRYRVDPSRVYVTGLSMGGYGTWSLIARSPERFAAAAPICGGGDLLRLLLLSGEQKEALKSLPIRVFHGGRDTVVPVAESERMVEAVRRAGCRDVQLKIYPEAGHDSWTATYEDPGFYEWLLAQHR